MAVAALAVAAGCAAENGRQPPRAAEARQIAPPDGEAALELAAGLVAAAPSRDAGSAGASAAAEWIAGMLRERGLDPAVDAFSDIAPGGSIDLRNVTAEIPPPGQEAGWIVLLSHYDTKSGIPGFVGANDGASSTGLLLELAARLAESGGDGRHGFLFAFLDGEECKVRYGRNDGLHGSRRLARQLKDEGRAVKAVLLFDMIGDRDLLVTIPRNGDRGLTLRALKAAEACGMRGLVRPGDGAVLDDHQPFLDAGFPAIDLIDFSYGSRPGANDYWHTVEDTVDKLSAESLRRVGLIALELIRNLD